MPCSNGIRIPRYKPPDHGLLEKKKLDRGDDTIAAIITPPGEGGIAAIRLAGPQSRPILNSLFRHELSQDTDPKPFMLRYGALHTASGEFIDEVTSVYMPHGKSYTGLEQVEIFCHGGRQVVRAILEQTLAGGARMAEPGEFTRLAFLNGKIDLARAEAVADIIAANTEQSLQASKHHLTGAYSERIAELREQLLKIRAEVEASIDFVEEDIDPADSAKLIAPMELLLESIKSLAATYTGGRIINEGYKVVIGGRPNAGKSSLFNVLLRQERALVNPEAGTTRDYLSEWIDLDGFAVNLVDTAGLRTGGDSVERAGQSRARERMVDADLIVWMADISESGWEKDLKADLDELPSIDTLLVGNKTDLLGKTGVETDPRVLYLSCRTGEGVDKLTESLVARINEKMPDLTDGLVVTSARHQQKLEIAAKSIEVALNNSRAGETPELIAFDLKEATEAIDEITGHVYTEEILGKIFSSFCIGK